MNATFLLLRSDLIQPPSATLSPGFEDSSMADISIRFGYATFTLHGFNRYLAAQ